MVVNPVQLPSILEVLTQQAAKVTLLPASAGLNRIFTGVRVPVFDFGNSPGSAGGLSPIKYTIFTDPTPAGLPLPLTPSEAGACL